ncbi:MAG: hypothetical protein HYY23_00180, partial [Verrucomicrobia bacterium]|nr:hypothetical protein [Verrucomicrobiota bacterium]
LLRVHSKQLLTQLRLSERRLGLLINFGELRLKDGIERIANGMPDEPKPGWAARLHAFVASFALLA